MPYSVLPYLTRKNFPPLCQLRQTPRLAKILDPPRPAPSHPTTEPSDKNKVVRTKRALPSSSTCRGLRSLVSAQTVTDNLFNSAIEMLDIFDFIVDKGGNPETIKESQRRRYAPIEAVDEVIFLYEDHRRSECRVRIGHMCSLTYCLTAQYQATQINTKINEVQKQIGVKRKVCLTLSTRYELVTVITVLFAG